MHKRILDELHEAAEDTSAAVRKAERVVKAAAQAVEDWESAHRMLLSLLRAHGCYGSVLVDEHYGSMNLRGGCEDCRRVAMRLIRRGFLAYPKTGKKSVSLASLEETDA